MRITCVVGTPRSGVSTVLEILGVLGVAREVPEDAPTGDDRDRLDRSRHRGVAHIDTEILRKVLDARPDDPPILVDGWERDGALEPFRREATRIYRDAFPSEAEHVAWGDEVASLLLPFWRTVRPVDDVIVCVRDPDQVVRSERARRDRQRTASTWVRYLVEAWRNTSEARLVVVRSTLSHDLRMIVDRLTEQLGLPPPTGEQRARIRRLVELAPSSNTESEDVGGPELRLARALYELAQRETSTTLDAIAERLHRWEVESIELRTEVQDATREAEAVRQEMSEKVRTARIEAARRTAGVELREEQIEHLLAQRGELVDQLDALQRRLDVLGQELEMSRRDLSRLLDRRSVRFALRIARLLRPLFRRIRRG